MRALICSGPNWSNEEITFDALDLINDIHEFSSVVWDEVEGVAAFAEVWSKSRNVPKITLLANGEGLELEGALSRSEMIFKESRPDLVISFRDNHNTSEIE